MARLRAPEFGPGRWVGTELPLTLRGLRGRFVLIEFWTAGCVNCLHVLDELHELEQHWGDALVVVGVHSPKFAHEADHEAVVRAVARLGVGHPVLDDASLTTWDAYTAKAWPTLVLVDPAGYVVAHVTGEGRGAELDARLATEVPRHEAAGTLVRSASPARRPPSGDGELRFPARALVLPARLGGGLLVADAGNDSLARLDARGQVSSRIAGFRAPQGLCLLPEAVATEVGYDVVVADTGSSLLRGVTVADGRVHTVAAGDGMSSPWDLAWWDERVWVAMAGIHQLWSFDPLTSRAVPVAGTRREGLRDGPAEEAEFAQPSGLAATPDALWLVDAETSALRRIVRSGPQSYAVETVVGAGLFAFGHVDGPGQVARLQHPLGLAARSDGTLLVADTYNGSVRAYDPVSDEMTTVAEGLEEPGDVVLDGDRVVVVESGAHRVWTPALSAPRMVIPPDRRPDAPLDLAPGPVSLSVEFATPPGQHLDATYGPATRLSVQATPPGLLLSGEGRGEQLTRALELDPVAAEGFLHIAASVLTCDDGGPAPACRRHARDWDVRVRIDPTGSAELVLRMDAQ